MMSSLNNYSLEAELKLTKYRKTKETIIKGGIGQGRGEHLGKDVIRKF